MTPDEVDLLWRRSVITRHLDGAGLEAVGERNVGLRRDGAVREHPLQDVDVGIRDEVELRVTRLVGVTSEVLAGPDDDRDLAGLLDGCRHDDGGSRVVVEHERQADVAQGLDVPTPGVDVLLTVQLLERQRLGQDGHDQLVGVVGGDDSPDALRHQYTAAQVLVLAYQPLFLVSHEHVSDGGCRTDSLVGPYLQ
ncbi:MAG TPA: hypothetical protein VGE30_03045 [Candidatus Saccharimonadales bacterium]